MWRLIPGQLLDYRCWDDEFVLYNNLSGDTHLLGAAAIAILSELKQGPASAASLGTALGAASDADAVALASLLAQLRALHLVEPDAC
ncbi:MAG: HPr-rel-A system PqqD family peptide chaperone [Massilia sp.]